MDEIMNKVLNEVEALMERYEKANEGKGVFDKSYYLEKSLPSIISNIEVRLNIIRGYRIGKVSYYNALYLYDVITLLSDIKITLNEFVRVNKIGSRNEMLREIERYERYNKDTLEDIRIVRNLH